MRELAWCIYNSGMKEQVIRNKWNDLLNAYYYFDIKIMVEYKDEIKKLALNIFAHKGKTDAVLNGAEKILKEGPMNLKLAVMSTESILTYLETFPFIGKVTRYHLARNIGFDVVKPDRHLVRISNYLKYESPDKLVQEIAELTGLKKGFIDFIIWRWLSLEGIDAYNKIENYIYE